MAMFVLRFLRHATTFLSPTAQLAQVLRQSSQLLFNGFRLIRDHIPCMLGGDGFNQCDPAFLISHRVVHVTFRDNVERPLIEFDFAVFILDDKAPFDNVK